MGLFDAIGGLFGGGPNNSGFQAQGVNQQQLGGAMATAGDAIAQQQALANALAMQGQQGMGSQTALTQALLSQMNGGGPNPAMAQLANSTGQNVANQGALMAGQRGAANNVGLMARQAANQGANMQQQAAGQGAVMQAQQQLAAQNQLQNLAGTQIGQQSGAVGNLNNFALQNQGQMMNMMANQNNANEGMSVANANNTAKALGGIAGGVGSALTGIKFAEGGMVPDHINKMSMLYHGGHYEHSENPKLAQVPQQDRFMGGGQVPGTPKVNENNVKNDVVDAKLTPKEIVLPLSVTESADPVKEAAKFVAAIMKKNGDGKKVEESDFKMALKDAIKSRKKKDA